MKSKTHTKKVSLSEKDYRAVTEVSERLLNCHDRAALDRCLRHDILPLLDSHAATLGWGEIVVPSQHKIEVNMLGKVGLTDKEFALWPAFCAYNKAMIGKVYAAERLTLAYDVDIPRNTLKAEVSAFFADHPGVNRREYRIGGNDWSFMTAFARFEQTLVAIILRYSRRPFTLRDTRVMELIRPILLQTARCIVMGEELARHKSLVEVLTNVPAGTALVTQGLRIVFANPAFRAALPLASGGGLPADLAQCLRAAIAQYDDVEMRLRNDPAGMSIDMENFFYRPAGKEESLRVELDRVDYRGGKKGERFFLLRLKPATDAQSKTTLHLQAAGLSRREIEIAYLLKDGFTNPEIAARLFISLYTVKSHVHKIFLKMNVAGRRELAAKLRAI